MPTAKRRLPHDEATILNPQSHRYNPASKPKRPRRETFIPRPPSRDIISTLSDELLVRIFSYLDEWNSINISPVSRRFCSLAADSHLWRAHYYQRFVPHPAASLHPSRTESVDWKKHYKLRHNWARGHCAVQEVRVSDDAAETLIRVADGLAITADLRHGMRAWDLRTGMTIAHAFIETGDGSINPTAMALDAQDLAGGLLGIILGFEDGTCGIWRLRVDDKRIYDIYRQKRGALGKLVSVAYAHPYAMTAAEPGSVSIYTFANDESSPPNAQQSTLPDPRLLTQLKSHHSRVPLALSISKTPSSTTASIAYPFTTLGGWSIGVQDFDIRPSVVTSRVAYTSPTETSPPRRKRLDLDEIQGPNKLVYSHPYLLATMPDNTLIMHICAATGNSLEISRGVRLWGHTSAIADADITPRGKAVSISMQGSELRVWELEGRVAGSSVRVRPRKGADDEGFYGRTGMPDRMSWVGFDREMIVVLKVGVDGTENMLVYDFA